MNILDIIAYVIIAMAAYRLVVMQGRCPMGWIMLVVGLGILYHRRKLN